MTSASLYPHIIAFAERGTLSVLAAAWQACLLITIIAVCLRLLPRVSASARSLIWTSVFLVILCLPLLPVPTSHAAVSGHAFRLHTGWALAIASAWLILSCIRGVRLFTSALHLRAVWKGSRAIETREPLQTRTAWGLERNATICTSPAVFRPSVIGFFSPRIIFPDELYARLSATDLDQVLLHEMEHLRRGDDWRNLLQKIGIVLFPLNPALIWVEQRLCQEREHACDESVLQKTHAPRSYAACLVHLAEESRLGRRLALAIGAWDRRSELGRRVEEILANRQTSIGSRRLGFTCASLLVAGISVLAGVLKHAPQLVSFAPVSVPAMSDAFATTPVQASATYVKARMPNAAERQPRMIETAMDLPMASRKSPAAQAKPVRHHGPGGAHYLLASPWTRAGRLTAASRQGNESEPHITFAVYSIYSTSIGFQVISTYATVRTRDGVLLLQL